MPSKLDLTETFMKKCKIEKYEKFSILELGENGFKWDDKNYSFKGLLKYQSPQFVKARQK